MGDEDPRFVRVEEERSLLCSRALPAHHDIVEYDASSPAVPGYATLQSSAAGRSVYARLGYGDLGTYLLWEHRPLTASR